MSKSNSLSLSLNERAFILSSLSCRFCDEEGEEGRVVLEREEDDGRRNEAAVEDEAPEPPAAAAESVVEGAVVGYTSSAVPVDRQAAVARPRCCNLGEHSRNHTRPSTWRPEPLIQLPGLSSDLCAQEIEGG